MFARLSKYFTDTSFTHFKSMHQKKIRLWFVQHSFQLHMSTVVPFDNWGCTKFQWLQLYVVTSRTNYGRVLMRSCLVRLQPSSNQSWKCISFIPCLFPLWGPKLAYIVLSSILPSNNPVIRLRVCDSPNVNFIGKVEILVQHSNHCTTPMRLGLREGRVNNCALWKFQKVLAV